MRFITRGGRGLLVLAAAVAVGLAGCEDNVANNGGGGGGVHVHKWGDWVVTTPATCNAQGVETRTCTQDASHKETRAIAQLTGTGCNSTGGNDSYDYVEIGGMKWMKKNLNIQTADSWCYGEGGEAYVDGEWKTLSSSEIQSNCNKYGRLYTWAAAKSACPSGWHLPTRDEWGALAKAAGGTGDYGRGGTAGTKLKSRSGWSGNGNGMDDFGFSALPGGYRDSYGDFYVADYDGGWWTASEYRSGSDLAYFRIMFSKGDGNVSEDNAFTSNGFSVRCVKE